MLSIWISGESLKNRAYSNNFEIDDWIRIGVWLEILDIVLPFLKIGDRKFVFHFFGKLPIFRDKLISLVRG